MQRIRRLFRIRKPCGMLACLVRAERGTRLPLRGRRGPQWARQRFAEGSNCQRAGAVKCSQFRFSGEGGLPFLLLNPCIREKNFRWLFPETHFSRVTILKHAQMHFHIEPSSHMGGVCTA
jgi:hypothetical protein